jgi:hypothetical protein
MSTLEQDLNEALGKKDQDPINLYLPLTTFVYAGVVTMVVMLYFWAVRLNPSAIPFRFTDWTSGFHMFDLHLVRTGIVAAWPIYVWALVIASLKRILHFRKTHQGRLEQFARGTYVSVAHAITEEVICRGLLPLYLTPIFVPIDSLTGGRFAQLCGAVIRWVVNPVTNFVASSFEHVIGRPFGSPFPLGSFSSDVDARMWPIVAAAIIMAFKFRNWNRYPTYNRRTTVLWRINSWFLGMMMFTLMLRYGLLTAIIVHALYDLVLLTHATLTSRFAPKPELVSESDSQTTQHRRPIWTDKQL